MPEDLKREGLIPEDLEPGNPAAGDHTPPRRRRALVRGAGAASGEERGGTKNMVLRLDPALAERLQVVAEVEGRSVSDVVREAINELVERRRADSGFIRLLEENLTRHERVLRALRDGES